MKKGKNNKYKKKIKNSETKRIVQFQLSENNRLTYVYENSVERGIEEIVCVSLGIKILDKWVTIIRYDNHHQGILHRHSIVAYNNEANIVDTNGTKRKGDINKLLKWAIQDIKNNFLIYKRKFIKRNRPLLKDVEVDEY